MTNAAPRVLHLRASNFFGGPERQILRYAELRDVSSSIASYTGDGCGTEFLSQAASQGLVAHELPAGKRSVGSAIRKLRQLLREHNIDLLCTHDYRSDLIGMLSVKRLGVPWVPFLRGWTAESSTIRAFEWLDRGVLRYADRVVCLSKTHAQIMGSLPSLAGKVRVVINAIDVDDITDDQRAAARRQLCDRYQLNGEQPIVVSAGRLSPEKGTAIFVQAIPQILERHGAAQFVIFGEGVERAALERRAEAMGISSAIRFAGHVRDFSALLQGADLLVNPSFAEQMPNVVLEAMAAGVPVVATGAGAVAEIAGDPQVIQVVAPGDSSAIASRVNELLKDTADLRSFGSSAQNRLRSAFSLEIQLSQLRDLCRELIPSLRQSSGALIPDRLPFISVVVPVRNEEKHISRVLDRLTAQQYPRDRIEIIVADGNSSDQTVAVVNSYRDRGVICIANPAQLSSAGRNSGIRCSRGELVLFVDGHCEIPSGSLLTDAVELFQSSGAECLARPQPLTIQDATNMQKVIAAVRGSVLGHGIDSTIFDTSYEGPVDPTSAGAMYRREVFEKIGVYDEAFDACEDVELNHRAKQAGLQCWTSPKMTVFYHPRQTLGGLFRQLERYGRGRCRLARKHPDAASFSQLVPALFVLGLPLGMLISAFWAPARAAYLSILALYILAICVSSLMLVRKLGGLCLVAPVVYLTIHVSLGVGFLKELIAGGRLPLETRKPNSLSPRGVHGGRS